MQRRVTDGRPKRLLPPFRLLPPPKRLRNARRLSVCLLATLGKKYWNTQILPQMFLSRTKKKNDLILESSVSVYGSRILQHYEIIKGIFHNLVHIWLTIDATFLCRSDKLWFFWLCNVLMQPFWTHRHVNRIFFIIIMIIMWKTSSVPKRVRNAIKFALAEACTLWVLLFELHYIRVI